MTALLFFINLPLVHALLLAGLFYLLAKAADVVVENLQAVSATLGIRNSLLGLMLGLFTTVPEFALGINALANNVIDVSLGNLLGGIVVELGLILGMSAVLSRKIVATEPLHRVIPMLLFIALPVYFALDGSIHHLEGALLIFLYAGLLFVSTSGRRGVSVKIIPAGQTTKRLFLIFLGIIGLLVVSSLIIHLTLRLVAQFNLPTFGVGLLMFSIGTNLPEIMVTIRSWRAHYREISFNYLLGSAMANILLIGLFALLNTIPVAPSLSYAFMLFVLPTLLILVAHFYKTNHALSRREGIMLVLFYVFFLVSETIITSIG